MLGFSSNGVFCGLTGYVFILFHFAFSALVVISPELQECWVIAFSLNLRISPTLEQSFKSKLRIFVRNPKDTLKKDSDSRWVLIIPLGHWNIKELVCVVVISSQSIFCRSGRSHCFVLWFFVFVFDFFYILLICVYARGPIWRSEVDRLGGNHLYLLSHLTGPGLSFQCSSEVALLSKRMCQLHTERTKSHCWALTHPTLRTFFRGSIQAQCLCCWQKTHRQLGSPAPQVVVTSQV